MIQLYILMPELDLLRFRVELQKNTTSDTSKFYLEKFLLRYIKFCSLPTNSAFYESMVKMSKYAKFQSLFHTH